MAYEPPLTEIYRLPNNVRGHPDHWINRNLKSDARIDQEGVIQARRKTSNDYGDFDEYPGRYEKVPTPHDIPMQTQVPPPNMGPNPTAPAGYGHQTFGYQQGQDEPSPLNPNHIPFSNERGSHAPDETRSRGFQPMGMDYMNHGFRSKTGSNQDRMFGYVPGKTFTHAQGSDSSPSVPTGVNMGSNHTPHSPPVMNAFPGTRTAKGSTPKGVNFNIPGSNSGHAQHQRRGPHPGHIPSNTFGYPPGPAGGNFGHNPFGQPMHGHGHQGPPAPASGQPMGGPTGGSFGMNFGGGPAGGPTGGPFGMNFGGGHGGIPPTGHGGPGHPIPPIPPSGHAGTSMTPYVSDRFKPKPDASAYKEYTNPANFVTWNEAWLITTRAQGLGRLFDDSYVVTLIASQQEAVTYMGDVE